MIARTTLVCQILVFVLESVLIAAPAAPAPPADADLPNLTTRQKDQLAQLADAEANIQAINKALFRTGYKVGSAYSLIDSNLKGNELMDRKGGGPVRWDEFYGRTARDYGSNGWGDRRPQQFDYIYKANNDKISQARDQIAALEGNKEALLARRRVHEDNQSRLWAMLAFAQITDQEVDDHEIDRQPICRFALKPAGPAANALRPIVLFLRTADSIAADGLEKVKTDQPTTFSATGQGMQAAYEELRKSLTDALDAAGLQPSQIARGREIKGLCKDLSEQCAVIADNYAKALDSDSAREDTSKLKFRATLQSSLYTFAMKVGKLHEEVIKTAKEWKVAADRTTPTPDTVAVVVIKAEPITPTAAKTNINNDLLQPGRVWIKTTENDKPPKFHGRLTVLDRNGESIRARLDVNPNIVRILSGTVKDGKFWWLARDVQAIKGGAGADNTGTINGDQIDFEYRDPSGKLLGTFTLKLEK